MWHQPSWRPEYSRQVTPIHGVWMGMLLVTARANVQSDSCAMSTGCCSIRNSEVADDGGHGKSHRQNDRDRRSRRARLEGTDDRGPPVRVVPRQPRRTADPRKPRLDEVDGPSV